MALHLSETTDKRFDVFLSYSSQSADLALRLTRGLGDRGVKVWLDKEQIRPGELVAEALERGITSSRVLAVLITPESLESGWVREEYNRALSLVTKGDLHLIPIIVGDVAAPGFLASRSRINLPHEGDWSRQLERLIWPGITGKSISCVWLLPEVPHHCNINTASKTYAQIAAYKKIEVKSIRYLISSLRHKHGYASTSTRTVAFVNMFEDDGFKPAASWTPREYADGIFDLRELTRGTADEWVFILSHHPGAMECCAHLKRKDVERLGHYFYLYHDESQEDMGWKWNDLWVRVQRYLMNTELDLEAVHKAHRTVTVSDLRVSAIFPQSRNIRKLRISLSFRGFVEESDIRCSNEGGELRITIDGGWQVDLDQSCTNPFLYLRQDGRQLVFEAAGHRGIGMDPWYTVAYKVAIRVDISNHSYVDLNLEWMAS